MKKKYELITSDREGLYRIKALRSFSDVKKGEIGGYVQSESNLSQNGNCWVYGDAEVRDNALVCGNAVLGGDAVVRGDARVHNNKDYIIFKNWWSSGRWFTWTRSNNMYKVGCFHGNGTELIEKAYKDSELSGMEYERIVNYVNSIIAEK